MIITGMQHFESVCKSKLVGWYNNPENNAVDKNTLIAVDDVFVVWSCKTLQNYKCICATKVSGDGIFVEYTFNGGKHELYEDVYKKLTNSCYADEYTHRTEYGCF